MAYYLSIASGTRQSLATLNITDASVTYVANGFDTLEFAVTAAVNASLYAYGTTVSLWTAASGGTCLFIGEITGSGLGIDTGSGSMRQYTAKSLLNRLELIQYTQSVNAYNEASTPTIASFADPCVILGRLAVSPYTRGTTGQVIAAVLAFAANKRSLDISVDSAVATRGSQPPLDQRENISCWEAIVCMLRWMPDHVLWCDYSSGTTVVKLSPASAMETETLAAANGTISEIRAKPRHDLRVSGVNIYYRKTFAVDGKTREQRFIRSAGNSSAADALNLYIDLEGSVKTTVSQAITTAALPAFSTPNSAACRAWLLSKVPWVGDLSQYEIKSWSRIRANGAGAASTNLSNELMEGTIQSWMSVNHQLQVVTAKIDYQVADSGGNVIESATTEIPVEVVATSATTHTYRKTLSYDSGESIPSGLETMIYNSWSMLHWDGSFVSDISTVGWVRPGKRINISGTASALASMAAVVQSTAVDLATGELSMTFGTCRALEADSLVTLYRATRGRRYAWRLLTDSSGTAGTGGDDGSAVTPHYNNANTSPALARKSARFAASDAGNRTHSFEINPSDLTFGDSTHAGNQEIKIRELPILVREDGALKVKIAQVFCGEAYGTAESIGGGTPSLPSQLTTLGSGAEGSTSPSATTWTAGNGVGLQEWYVSRVVYDDTTDSILYAFLRKRIYDANGLLYSVSDETRVVVDVPEYA